MIGRTGERSGADVLCLCYHAVSADWPAPLAVTPARLEWQLSRLVRGGWVGATFTQAILDPPAPRTLAVTFDDAFASVIVQALPILSDLGLPATVFAPTAFISSRQPLAWDGIAHWAGTAHAHELVSMDWGDLRTLADRGWEIGAHTHTHPRLTALDDRALAEELEGSRSACEAELGAPCGSIAYPYGAVDERVARAARAAGYVAGACLSSNLRAGGRHLVPRIGVYNADDAGRFALKVNRATRLARASRLWPEPRAVTRSPRDPLTAR
jgi:peptidoglycan/xylan/chitin deacetylase (PgdA/CDA1 family)